MRQAYWKHRPSKIPEVDSKKTYLHVNHTNLRMLLSLAINSIEISSTDPTRHVREYLELSDEELSKTDVFKKLSHEMEYAHTSTKKKIEEWIAEGLLEYYFKEYYDFYNEEDIDDLCYQHPLGRRLRNFQDYNPIPFKWMWIIYREFRRETRPSSPMCDCCYHHDDDDDKPKLTFQKFFNDTKYTFQTKFTEHSTYYYNIVDFLRLAYRAILEIPDTPAPETKPISEPSVAQPELQSQPEPVCEIVPLVSDEELLAKIAELKAKNPAQTSVKSLCKLLKCDKPEWQVTETRITKLLKKR